MVEEEFTKYELEDLLELERELEEEENRNCNDLCIEKPSLGDENGGEEGPEAEALPHKRFFSNKTSTNNLCRRTQNTTQMVSHHHFNPNQASLRKNSSICVQLQEYNSHTVHAKPSQLLSRITYSLHPHAFFASQNSSNKVTTGDMPYT
ncbi:hypothetical protein ACOSQ2_032143 [Xanthoceras sorbifolium]